MKNIFFAIIIGLTGCSSNPELTTKTKLSAFEWMSGSWKMETPDGELVETWTKQNDTLITGFTYMLENSDTVFTEKLSLQQNGDQVFYIPVVSNQNNSQPVNFEWISEEKEEFVFENKAHDFPQRIIYKHLQPDTMYARIEGTQKGKFRKEDFKMIRVK